MADFARIRRASLLHGGRPAIIAIVQRFKGALSKPNGMACTSSIYIDEAEQMLKLSDRELSDVGLRRSDIRAYIYRQTNPKA